MPISFRSAPILVASRPTNGALEWHLVPRDREGWNRRERLRRRAPRTGFFCYATPVHPATGMDNDVTFLPT